MTPPVMWLLCLFVPQAIFDANPAKVVQVTAIVWEQGVNSAPNTGWTTVEKISNPTKTGQIYVVTELQVRREWTPAQIQRLKDKLDGAGVEYRRTQDWESDLLAAGWRVRQVPK